MVATGSRSPRARSNGVFSARALPLVLVAVMGSAQCRRGGEETRPLGAPLFELRDAEGRPVLYVRRAPNGFHFADLRARSEGDLVFQDKVVRGPNGEARRTEDGGLDIKRAQGPLLTLRRVDGALRLGDGSGVPWARVQRLGDAEAVAYDASGIILAQARVGGGRIVLSDREGKTIGYVTGDASVERAALLLLPALSSEDRALLLLPH